MTSTVDLELEIEQIIKKSKTPPMMLDVCKKISGARGEDISTLSVEVSGFIRKNPDLFLEVQGRVVSTSSEKWKAVITSYWYILEVLQPLPNPNDLQFIIAALFFYKRLCDIKISAINEVEVELGRAKPFLVAASLTEAPKQWLDSLYNLEAELDLRLPILKELSRLLSDIPVQKLIGILQVLHATNTSVFSHAEYGFFFEHVIDANTARTHRHPIPRTPAQVCELMARVLDVKHGRVYDPACGTGSLLTSLITDASRKYISFYGSDISYRSSQLALMNLWMHDVTDASIKSEDSLGVYADTQYDYIISELPLILQTEVSYRAGKPGLSLFIEFVISSLSQKGRAAIIVPDRFLSSGGANEKFRRQLLEFDIVESVLSLPVGSLRPYTNGKSSILVLNKAKPSSLINKVRFVNVQSITPGSSQPFLDFDAAYADYVDRENSRHARTVGVEEVFSHGALNTSPYTENLQEIERLYKDGKANKLFELVEIISGSAKKDSNQLQGYIPYIKIENLEKDILDMRLAAERATNKANKHAHSKRTFISEECLLIARIGDNLKPTIFKPTKLTPDIIIHTGVLALKPIKDSSVDIEYLYYQLYTPLVQKQIEQKRAGSVMPFLNKNALGSVIIPIMPIKSQRQFVETQKANIISAEKEKVNQRLRAIGFEEESIQKESDLISTLVHELRPKLVKINSLSNKLNRIIEKHNLAHLMEYSEEEIIALTDPAGLAELPENQELGETIHKISDSSQKLSETLSLVKEIMTLNLNPGDFQSTNLLVFLRNRLLSRSCESPHKYQIEIKGLDVEVFIHQQTFQHVLDQLIANAEHHAFINPSPKDKMVFNVKEDKERSLAIIEYSNNGMPFKLRKEEYIQFFTKSKSSTGSGIGGNYIYRIIKAHNGDIIINDALKTGFFLRIEIPTKGEKQ